MMLDMEKLIRYMGVQITPEATHLLQQMMALDPRERYTLDEVRSHPWVVDSDGH